MAGINLQLGGGYTYQWECAILLALNYFFEPVCYNPTLFDLVNDFLGQVAEIHLEGEDRASGTDLEDINLVSGDRRILIQVKTKQAEGERWTPTDPLLLKALYRFYDNRFLIEQPDNTRFVFLTNRPFNRALVRVKSAIKKSTIDSCAEAEKLCRHLDKFAQREKGTPINTYRFREMLARTALVEYLAVDEVKANVQTKLQACGKCDWEQTYAVLFEHFARQSIRIGGGTVTQESLSRVLGSSALPGSEIEILNDYLARAVAAYEARMYQLLTRPLPPRQPYKFLYAFESEDASIFFGRDAASKALYQTILKDRLTVLHARSGAGKTSLINAGLSPRLIREGRLPVYARTHEDPVRAIKRAIAPPSLGPWPKLLPSLSLHEFLGLSCNHLSRQTGELVIILDQFEDFFVFGPERGQRQSFIDTLADCCDDKSLLVRFVIALRKDYYSDLVDFQKRIPTILYNEYRLDALTRDEATRAITLPLDDTGMAWEPQAVRVLLDYLDQGKVDPSQLQLICSTLYEKARDAGKTMISVEGVNLYSIHADYLVGEMSASSFPPTQRELGWRLLKRLITSQGTRQVLPLKELYKVAPPNEVDPVLQRLVDRRLLRRDEVEGETLIEVAHDTLAARIETYETDWERRDKVARELVERGLANWRQVKRLGQTEQLMGPSMLNVLYEYRQHLIDLDPEALKFLFRSALAAEHKTADWFKLAQQAGVPINEIDEIALEDLLCSDFLARARRVDALAQLGDRYVPHIADRLNDQYPQVRVAAIAALERLCPEGKWRGHLVYERYVPSGKFTMGDDDSFENDCTPAQLVHLNAFHVGRYPVTNADYALFVEATDHEPPQHWGSMVPPKEIADHPVTGVSWYDAREYANWARMRLLTEAEWEKAASWDEQNAAKRQFPWGDCFDENKCNTKESSVEGTTPVGQYSDQGGDSSYGCADMAGNVWEWTGSLYRGYPYQADDGREDLSILGSRVLRGGSFFLGRNLARTVHRSWSAPERRSRNVGFRVGLSSLAQPT